jgi:hypothetical protein
MTNSKINTNISFSLEYDFSKYNKNGAIVQKYSGELAFLKRMCKLTHLAMISYFHLG